MIIGIGLDVLQVSRLRRAMERHPRLLRRVFTERERATCARKADPAVSLAARFCAKEAAMKALGTGWGGGVGWRDLEVAGGAGRPPRLELHGLAARRFATMGGRLALVSLTHERELAAAVVIFEGEPP